MNLLRRDRSPSAAALIDPGTTRDPGRRTSGAGGSPDGRMMRRVRWRLVGWSALITATILLVLGTAIYVIVDRSISADLDGRLQSRVQGIERTLTGGPGGGDDSLGYDFGGGGTLAFLISPSGTVTSGRFAYNIGPDAAGLAAARNLQANSRDVEIQGHDFRVLSVPIETSQGVYVLQVFGDRSSLEQTLARLLVVLIGGGVGALVLAVAGGWIYADRALVPIRESMRRQREFTADASHELRTPLAVIKSSVEDLERNREKPVGEVGEALTDIKAEADHLTALVGDLLFLARTDSGAAQVEPLPIDLGYVAAEALDPMAQMASKRGVTLALDPEPAPILGDSLRLRQLVTILTDNAIKHSPNPGTVTLRVRRVAKEAVLTVEDEGPGFRPEDLEHVFDRFWRAAGAPVGGTGLGLSIASAIVEQHHGSISAGNREPAATGDVTVSAETVGSVPARGPAGARMTVRIPLDTTAPGALGATDSAVSGSAGPGSAGESLLG